MKAGSYGLKHGRVLVLFPEGERSIDGTPKLFKKGAAILSYHHQVPIVPVALEGFFEAWPRGAGFLRSARLQISIGTPIYPPKTAARAEAAYETITADLRNAVHALWEPMHAKNDFAKKKAQAAHQP
jgi:1-acyl-sn-glycerol-3-phosphate acyltransferase